jgi:hypothetical protein
MNHMYVDSEDSAALNEETLKYKRQLQEGTAGIVVACTMGALVYGVCMLPARKSALKYTVGGFALGVGLAYGFWRVQLNQYDRKVNQIFRKIVREQFRERQRE